MDINELNSRDRFAHDNGIQLTLVSDTESRAEMKVENYHLNGADVCQGGALFTLADLAMAALANRVNFPTLTINAQISFVHSAFEGDCLLAVCKQVAGGKLPIFEVEITNQKDELIARVGGQCYKKNKQPK